MKKISIIFLLTVLALSFTIEDQTTKNPGPLTVRIP